MRARQAPRVEEAGGAAVTQAEDARPIVQMTRLGRMGRWANMLFQYAFLRVYARRRGARVEVPHWAGRDVYGFDDPRPSRALPEWLEATDPQEQAFPPAGDEVLDHDFVGYGQVHTSWYAPDREFLCSLYSSPVPAVAARMAGPVAALRSRGRTVVGVHLRRGDYGQSIFYLTPVEWYLRLLEHLWPTLDAPALFVATEDPALVERFAAYHPVTAEGLGVDFRPVAAPGLPHLRPDLVERDARALDFYPDFHLLQQCDVMLAPNSSYSFMAAMLAPTLTQFWRSSLRTQGFAREDPWDAYPLQHDRVQDFAHVEGVALQANRYW